MKVYIVTAGSYSDFHNVGVYSTKEKAEEFRQALAKTKEPDTDIEEYELDAEKVNYFNTLVDMDIRGNVLYTRLELNGQTGFRWFSKFSDEPVLIWSVQTEDEERAVKVVNEKRAQIIAEGIWGDDQAVKDRLTIND